MRFMDLAYTDKEVDLKRKRVAQRLIESSPNIHGEQIKRLSTLDLILLFDLYKKEFFAIMVPAKGGSYTDQNGIRYNKYYAPLNALSLRKV